MADKKGGRFEGGEEEEEDPYDVRINKSGCAEHHYALQDCWHEHQDWRKCQQQMKDFQQCMAKNQKTASK